MITAATLGACVRHYGGIEARPHSVRDLTYDEDRSPVRTHSGPRAMARLRNTAIGLLRTRGVTNIQGALNHVGRPPDQVVPLPLG